jgi:PAS domain S-box-containing protein
MAEHLQPLAPQDVLESYFANVQRSETILMVMLDMHGMITAVNRATALLFGSTPERLVGSDWFDIAIAPEERAQMREMFHRLVQGGPGGVYENPVRLPGDRSRRILWSNSLIRDGDRVSGTLSFGIDISDRIALEKKLRRDDYLLQRAEEIAGLGTYILDVPKGVWTCSPVMDGIFGIGSDDPKTVESWAACIHPDDRDAMVSYFRDEVLGQRQKFDRVYRIIRQSDKAVRWVHGYGALEADASGTIISMIGAIRDITDSHETRRTLEESESKYRTIFDKAPVGIARVGMDKKFLDGNTAFLNFLGYTIQELRTKTIADVTHADDQRIGMEEMSLMTRGSLESAAVEKRYLRKDGGVVWGRTVINLVRHADGAPAYFLPLIRDITLERLNADRAKLAEQRYHLATQHTGMLVYDWDIVANTLSWEGAIELLTGFTPDAFPASTIAGWTELIHPSDRARALELLEKAQKENGSYNTTYRFRRNDGSYITVEDSGSFISDNGTAVRMVGVMRDISSFNAEHQRSIASEALFRAIFELAPVAIGIHREGKFLFVNPAGARMMGGSDPKDFVGSSVFDFIAPEERDRFMQRAKIIKESNVLPIVQATFLKRTGERYRVEIRTQQIDYQDAPATLSIISDVSQSSQMLAELTALMNSMRDGFAEHEIITDAQGKPVDYRFLIVNPAFERITGKKASDTIGHTVKEVLPGTEDVWIERFGAVALTGIPAEFTAQAKDVGGKSFHVRAWSSRKNHFAVLFSDVSESKKVADTLQDILDKALDTIVIISPTGTCKYQNAASLPLLGYKPEELMGKNLLSFVNPLDLPKATAQIAVGLSKPSTPLPLTYRFKHKDGSWRTLESVGINLLADPFVEGILIFSRDVTEIIKGREAAAHADDLGRMNKLMVDRELRIAELKAQVKELTGKLEAATQNPAS